MAALEEAKQPLPLAPTPKGAGGPSPVVLTLLQVQRNRALARGLVAIEILTSMGNGKLTSSHSFRRGAGGEAAVRFQRLEPLPPQLVPAPADAPSPHSPQTNNSPLHPLHKYAAPGPDSSKSAA